MINRRAFVAGLGAVLAAPFATEAQQTPKLPRVGYASLNMRTVTVEAFEQGLRQFGYVLGQNIIVDYRFADGHVERVPVLVNELLATGIDVLFAANPHILRVAIQATTTVSIVGIDLETDPVRVGWVKTLARPGGNVTGFLLDMPELSAKQVQFLTEAIPRLQRLAVMWDAEVASSQLSARYVDQILKGAKASDLPIQRPVLLDFALNLKTAKALGLTIPQSLLVRADEVIQ